MDTFTLRRMLRTIDGIGAEEMEARYTKLNELLAFIKREAQGDQKFERHDVLVRLLKIIDNIPDEQIERRYFQLVSLMIFIKRQALLDKSYEDKVFHPSDSTTFSNIP